MNGKTIEGLSIDTIRTLVMDAVQKAESGHPGSAMSMAPVAYTLWQNFLRYDPANPSWPNRDRFVLSAGHLSMLLYSTLHLVGVRDAEGKEAISLDEIRHFRQLGSRCAGHPEFHLAPGIETSTGPLGQGCAVSVGMAMGAKWLAARYNRPGFPLFSYRTYALCGDGCLMEGVAYEAASLAGHLRLDNLCWIYDSNRITIEGKTDLSFSEDVAARFRACGWLVFDVGDANDLAALGKAFTSAGQARQPVLVIVHSQIAYGAPNKQGSHTAHGEPLGVEEVKQTKRRYGWSETEHFLVPNEVRDHFQAGIGARGREESGKWAALFATYRQRYPELAADLDLMSAGELPAGWEKDLPVFPADPKGVATRVSSGTVLNSVAKRVPWLLGGAADLAPSTKTLITDKTAGDFSAQNYGGRNIRFGIREHAMGAIANGLAHCGLRPYVSTFFVFTDYMRTPIRLSALMRLPVLYVLTHDSIAVGEDGPTHEPVEHLASLRAIPDLTLLRPADANEVSECWRLALNHKNGPCALVLTRQNLATIDRQKYAAASGVQCGAYILAGKEDEVPEVLIMASGSEVNLCLAAYEKLVERGVKARVVSFPSWSVFEAQPLAYREKVLPLKVTARLAVEAASPFGWDRYVGPAGAVLGVATFGASAPPAVVFEKFGFTVDNVVEKALALLGNK